MSEAILRLAADPSLRERLGAEGRRRYKDGLDHRQMSRTIRDLYVRLLGQGRGAFLECGDSSPLCCVVPRVADHRSKAAMNRRTPKQGKQRTTYCGYLSRESWKSGLFGKTRMPVAAEIVEGRGFR